MLSKGYHRSNFDHCVYYKRIRNDLFIYLLIYVDDMLIACKDKGEIKKLKIILKSEFDMKDLGAARRILGIDIIRDRNRGTPKLTQSGYLKKVVNVFETSDCKTV